jgi:hypothetical protein
MKAVDVTATLALGPKLFGKMHLPDNGFVAVCRQSCLR